ncbi:hypothetical protein B0T13DRAFT_227149 [Neurospora crassa]|nr:hypothetical protein B0T13DRAFT_227149 [Neurospora crassa]
MWILFYGQTFIQQVIWLVFCLLHVLLSSHCCLELFSFFYLPSFYATTSRLKPRTPSAFPSQPLVGPCPGRDLPSRQVLASQFHPVRTPSDPRNQPAKGTA